MKKLVILISILTLLLVLNVRQCYATTYTVTPIIEAQYPSKMTIKINATVSPADSACKVQLILGWATNEIHQEVTQNGFVSFSITSPSKDISTTLKYVTFHSPQSEFTDVTRNLVIVNGVKADLTYEQTQYYAPLGDPYPNYDILIQTRALDTELLNPVEASYEISGSGVSIAKDEVVDMYHDKLYLKILDETVIFPKTYTIDVKPKATGLLSCSSKATVTVNPPKVVVKCEFSTGEIFYARAFPPNDVKSGASWMKFTVMNTKGFELTINNPQVYYVSSSVVTEEQIGFVNRLSDSTYRIDFSFTESSYTFRISGYVNGYHNLTPDEGRLGINTSGSPSIFTFILNAPVLLTFALIGIGIYWKFFRKKKVQQ